MDVMYIRHRYSHRKIPLESIVSATNNFSDQNLIREGGFGKIYKGHKFLHREHSIDIVARRLDPKYGQGDKELYTEISMLSSLDHENIVSFVGFCDQDEEKIIVNEYAANSSLDKYLSEPTLTWTQRLQICVGVASALSNIYYGAGARNGPRVIHRNIKSSKILLDHNWKPKLSGYELSVESPLRQRDRLLVSELSGTYGYVDPAYEKTGKVSHKSDIFSLGVVLFEVLCGRRAFIPIECEEQSLMFTMKRLEYFNVPKDRLLSRLARSRYKEGKLDEIINPDIRKQMDQRSYIIFSNTAYRCLNEKRSQRPQIYLVIKRLEKALKLQHEYYHIFLSRNPPATKGLPFLSDNPLINQANGNIMSFSLHEFAHLRIPLEDISSATNNFADENILGLGGAGKLYKGQLKWSGQMIDIVARRLGGVYGEKHIELWTEISMLSSLKHNNLVSVFGFCDEYGETIIIYKQAVYGCLDQYLSDPAFTWSQRLKICLGVARALSYIHYDVIHCDISSSNILIDEDWEPKVFGFELSTKYPGSFAHRLLVSHYFDTSAYRDPMYRNTLSVTPKYDVYSFGVLLYDVLFRGKPVSNYYGVMENLHEMINPSLRKQMDTQSLIIFRKTAYNCLNQECAQRPSMDQIVKELENALKLQWKPENFEHSTLADEATSSYSLTKENMERLKIPLSDIIFATNNFDKRLCIGSGGYGMVYKAELEHLDIQNISSSDWNNTNDLPKKRSIVAIKRIFNKEGEEGFFVEIETLTSCNHPNIVSLLGFSREDREMILVFEFVLNGSLDNCLENNTMANVTWAQRVQICLDVACGLKYLHANTEGKRRIVHRDVKSANILLDGKWNAKVADFGLSKFHPENQHVSTIHTMHIVGTDVYLDPEYSSAYKYKKESDIYSFGVVLFEILSGKLAYDSIYYVENDNGLPDVARRHFKEGTIKELIDPNMMEDANKHIVTVNKGPNQMSLDAFTKIAYQCLAETQVTRPKMEDIIKELEDALHFQEESLVLMKFQLSDIVLATKNFAAEYCIGVGAYGMMYNAKFDFFDTKCLSEIEWENGGYPLKKHTNVALKRIFIREDGHGKQGFFEEIQMLASFMHPNIVSLLGVSSENREMILIYKDAFKGSLHDYLGNTHKMAELTWSRRIQICLDIAQGLSYLQTRPEEKQRIMRFDMNRANILLDDDWRAKIACFWLSIINPASKEATNTVARKVQLEPEYMRIEKLKKESGVYSFGVMLFEIMCGKSQFDEIYYVKNEKGLPTIARRCFEEGTLFQEMIDPVLKRMIDENSSGLDEEVNRYSFDAFSKIAYRCCTVTEAYSPSMEVIIKELKNALKFQVDYKSKKFNRFLGPEKKERLENLKHLENLKITLLDILLATEKFSVQYLIRLGGCGYSAVYKAELDHFDATNSFVVEGKNKGELPKKHSSVAIKRIYSKENEQNEPGFIVEVDTLSNCNHPNIVSLLGFCDEGDEMIVVLEYASNGSLDDYLENLDKMTNLTWVQRMQICLDIAYGLEYLQTQMIIHGDIQSSNILLNENMVAKIAHFGHHAYRYSVGNQTFKTVREKVYVDPEYMETGKLKEECDIYSFGVVLFEIMTGKLAYDKVFDKAGLPTMARKCFLDGTLKQIIDPRMMEYDGNIFMLKGYVNPASFDTFSRIAYRCLAELSSKRPEIEAVIKELEKAYHFQITNKNKLQISLEGIQLMTENFSDRKCIGEGKNWKQYEGELAQANGYITVVAKRFDRNSNKQRHLFLKELEILCEYKHKNIIGVAGYCQDKDEKIIVYKHASNGRLNEHLDDPCVTWMNRLKIGIDIARGLHFLHTGGEGRKIPLRHTDIKSASILLEGDWTAKISNLEFSGNSWEHKEVEHVTDNVYGSFGYLDPQYEQSGCLTQKSDIYSLGVVLVEMLCGRLSWVEGCEDHSHSLGPLVKHCFKEGKLGELVFEGIKEKINPESLAIFTDIALRCLKDNGGERPKAYEVAIQLKKALQFQEDFEIWEPKLRDYEDVLRFVEIKKNTKKKDIYNKLINKGVFLKDREVFLSLGIDGHKQYMISAKKFSYKNRRALTWESYSWRYSRFKTVADVLTVSNLNIKIKIRTWFLSPGVNYGVHLVFTFRDSSKIPFPFKPLYVNLTYTMRNETFHAYFATERNTWLATELFRFLKYKEDSNFEILLESFSSYYCGKEGIYIQGIEFRVIDDVKNQGREKAKEVQPVLKSNSNKAQLFSLNEMNRKKQLMLSAKEVLYNSSNVKHLQLKPSAHSRFQEVVELLPQQVLQINCKIQSQMLSQHTEYSCYLVFKLSEKCRGLHCPVKVRDLPQQKNKEDKNIYFRSPNPWNLHDFNHIPEQREDGWMEVNLLNFNSDQKLQNECIWVNLKLISYEGNMGGLIICGIEFRPIQ